MSEMLTQIFTCWWMHDVTSKENIEDLGTDGVDSGQLHVDLEAWQRLERVCGEVLLTFLEEINPGCSTFDMRNWPLFYYYYFKAYT